MAWFGWIRSGGEWERVTGPHGRLGEASRALGDEARRRGLSANTRDQVLTSGAEPPAGPMEVDRHGK
jgi:hypothetical protein